MDKKPIIGVSMSMLKDASGVFAGYERAYVNNDYIYSVIRGDAIALPLPINEDEESLEYYTDIIDGLILSGGHDVDPRLYHEEIDQKTEDIYPRRDQFDLALIRKMVEKKKPILGICRGFQLLNIAFGGTILQDTTLSKTKLMKHWQNQDCDMPVQDVRFSGDSFFSQLYGEKTSVNSWHHQIIKDVAPCFMVCGKTSDGVIEAIEDRDRRILGVQWHPEMLMKNETKKENIFSAFVQLIKKGEKNVRK